MATTMAAVHHSLGAFPSGPSTERAIQVAPPFLGWPRPRSDQSHSGRAKGHSGLGQIP